MCGTEGREAANPGRGVGTELKNPSGAGLDERGVAAVNAADSFQFCLRYVGTRWIIG